jgi:hypothetical protein
MAKLMIPARHIKTSDRFASDSILFDYSDCQGMVLAFYIRLTGLFAPIANLISYSLLN